MWLSCNEDVSWYGMTLRRVATNWRRTVFTFACFDCVRMVCGRVRVRVCVRVCVYVCVCVFVDI